MVFRKNWLVSCIVALIILPQSLNAQRFDNETHGEYVDRVLEHSKGVVSWIQQQGPRFQGMPEFLDYHQRSKEMFQSLSTIVSQIEQEKELNSHDPSLAPEREAQFEAEIATIEKKKAELRREFLVFLQAHQKVGTADRLKENAEYEYKKDKLKREQISWQEKVIMGSGFNAKLKKLSEMAARPDVLNKEIKRGWIFKRPIKYSSQLNTKAIRSACKIIPEKAFASFHLKKNEVEEEVAHLTDLDAIIEAYKQFETWQKKQFLHYREGILFTAIYQFSIDELEEQSTQFTKKIKKSIKDAFIKPSVGTKSSLDTVITDFEASKDKLVATFLSTFKKNHRYDIEELKSQIDELHRQFEKEQSLRTEQLAGVLAKSLDLDIDLNPHIKKFYDAIRRIQKSKVSTPPAGDFGKKVYREYLKQFDMIIEQGKRETPISLAKNKAEYCSSRDTTCDSTELNNTLSSFIAEEIKKIEKSTKFISERYRVFRKAVSHINNVAAKLNENSELRFASAKILRYLKNSLDEMTKNIWDSNKSSFQNQSDNINDCCDVLISMSRVSHSQGIKSHFLAIRQKIEKLLTSLEHVDRTLPRQDDGDFDLSELRNNLDALLKETENLHISSYFAIGDTMLNIVSLNVRLNKSEQELFTWEEKQRVASNLINKSNNYKQRIISAFKAFSRPLLQTQASLQIDLESTINSLEEAISAKLDSKVSGLLRFLNQGQGIYSIESEFAAYIENLVVEKDIDKYFIDIHSAFLDSLESGQFDYIKIDENSPCENRWILESFASFVGVFSKKDKRLFYPYLRVVHKFLSAVDKNQVMWDHNYHTGILQNQNLNALLNEIFTEQQSNFIKSILKKERPRSIHGLDNYGFTCYFNSIIKLIINSDLRQFISSKKELNRVFSELDGLESEEHYELRLQFKNTFNRLSDILLGISTDIDESTYKHELYELLQLFSRIKNISFEELNRFQDVAEYLQYVLDILEVSPEEHGVQIREIEEEFGAIKSDVIRSTNIWIVNIYSGSIQNSIVRSLNQKSGDKETKISFEKLPQTMIIQQNRLKASENVTNPLGYEKDLRSSKIKTRIELEPTRKYLLWGRGKVSYRLKGIVIHQGKEVDRGHYVYLDVTENRFPSAVLHDDENVQTLGQFGSLPKYYEEMIDQNAVLLVYEKN